MSDGTRASIRNRRHSRVAPEVGWRMKSRTTLGWVIAASCLTGCTLQASRPPAPALPESFAQAASTTTAPPKWPSSDWYRGFGSTELDGLIDQAVANNLDLQAAHWRIEQALERAKQAHAGLLPTSTDWAISTISPVTPATADCTRPTGPVCCRQLRDRFLGEKPGSCRLRAELPDSVPRRPRHARAHHTGGDGQRILSTPVAA